MLHNDTRKKGNPSFSLFLDSAPTTTCFVASSIAEDKTSWQQATSACGGGTSIESCSLNAVVFCV
jgi:hypothetical protein